MGERIWVRPEIVAQFEFLEWTSGDQLRHTKYIGLRPDQTARDVVQEHENVRTAVTR